MQIFVHTDNHIRNGENLKQLIESTVESMLSRFGNRITRVEVHLTDESSSAKGGAADMRCAMEARVAGLQPIAVSHESDSLEKSIDAAADKLEKTLDKTFSRLDDRKGRPSFSGDVK
jgi:ribosomal subunit interface protein